jgi:L-rhamnose mutarotase
MQRTIVVCVFKVALLFAPCAGWSAEPGGALPEGGERQNWVRRQGQLAKLLTDQMATFRELAETSTVQPVLLKHGVKNHELFLIELERGAYYTLRYYEYTGRNFLEDMRRLETDVSYKKWSDKVAACLANGWSDVECVFYTAGQRDSNVVEGRVKRLGRVVGLRPEMAEPYKLLHAHTWPGVLSAIREGNIRNYSIFLAPAGSQLYLFAYLEYVGDDFDSDMARIGSDPDTKAWIKFTDVGCQLPISTRKPGEWWAGMERLSGEKGAASK